MHVDLIRDTAKVMPSLADPKAIRSLRIWHCHYKSLASLAEIDHLQTLVIATFPDDTLMMLRNLKRLTYLRILHLPRVNDLSPLAGLESLESLALETLPSWDVSGKLTIVKTLEPIGKLRKLRHLELFGVVPKDKSLSAIEQCQRLITACFSKYPKREVDRFYQATGVSNTQVPKPVFEAS